MEPKNCPFNNKECCETKCAWFIESNDINGQKELYGCAVKLLVIAMTHKMSDTKK